MLDGWLGLGWVNQLVVGTIEVAQRGVDGGKLVFT